MPCRWGERWRAIERVCELFSVLKGVPRIPGKELREMEGQHKTFSIPRFANGHFPSLPISSVSPEGLFLFVLSVYLMWKV